MNDDEARLGYLVWGLIYGGMLAASLGWFTGNHSVGLGWTLMVGGAGAVAAGIVLIVVRSRTTNDPAAATATKPPTTKESP